MRVLLVDDETLALDRLTSFFGDIEGVEVVGRATDGNMALDKIRELLPELVIMDIQMPGRTGLRAAADIDVEPRPELIFVTAHEHYAPDAFEVDAADYVLWRNGGPLQNDPSAGVQAADYDFWRARFGNAAGPSGPSSLFRGPVFYVTAFSGAGSAGPEPTSVILIGIGIGVLAATDRRRAASN